MSAAKSRALLEGTQVPNGERHSASRPSPTSSRVIRLGDAGRRMQLTAWIRRQ